MILDHSPTHQIWFERVELIPYQINLNDKEHNRVTVSFLIKMFPFHWHLGVT